MKKDNKDSKAYAIIRLNIWLLKLLMNEITFKQQQILDHLA